MSDKLRNYKTLYEVELSKRSDTGGVFLGGGLAALCVVINTVYEEAALAVEKNTTGHGRRKGGSDAGDAARRVDAATIRNLKMDFDKRWEKP